MNINIPRGCEIVCFAMNESSPDRERMQALANRYRCNVFGCSEAKASTLVREHNFSTWRGFRQCLLEKTVGGILDYFWLQGNYYKDRYGMNWLTMIPRAMRELPNLEWFILPVDASGNLHQMFQEKEEKDFKFEKMTRALAERIHPLVLATADTQKKFRDVDFSVHWRYLDAKFPFLLIQRLDPKEAPKRGPVVQARGPKKVQRIRNCKEIGVVNPSGRESQRTFCTRDEVVRFVPKSRRYISSETMIRKLHPNARNEILVQLGLAEEVRRPAPRKLLCDNTQGFADRVRCIYRQRKKFELGILGGMPGTMNPASMIEIFKEFQKVPGFYFIDCGASFGITVLQAACLDKYKKALGVELAKSQGDVLYQQFAQYAEQTGVDQDKVQMFFDQDATQFEAKEFGLDPGALHNAHVFTFWEGWRQESKQTLLKKFREWGVKCICIAGRSRDNTQDPEDILKWLGKDMYKHVITLTGLKMQKETKQAHFFVRRE